MVITNLKTNGPENEEEYFSKEFDETDKQSAKKYIEENLKGSKDFDRSVIISFDGEHGSGKNTQIKMLSNYLSRSETKTGKKKTKYKVKIFRETDKDLDNMTKNYAGLRKSYIKEALDIARELTREGELEDINSIPFESSKLRNLYHQTREYMWQRYIIPFLKEGNQQKVAILNRSFISSIAMGMIEDEESKLSQLTMESCPLNIIKPDISFILIGETNQLYNNLKERAREEGRRSFKDEKNWIDPLYELIYIIKNKRSDEREIMRRWWLDKSREVYTKLNGALGISKQIETTREKNGKYERIGRRKINENITKYFSSKGY